MNSFLVVKVVDSGPWRRRFWAATIVVSARGWSFWGKLLRSLGIKLLYQTLPSFSISITACLRPMPPPPCGDTPTWNCWGSWSSPWVNLGFPHLLLEEDGIVDMPTARKNLPPGWRYCRSWIAGVLLVGHGVEGASAGGELVCRSWVRSSSCIAV